VKGPVKVTGVVGAGYWAISEVTSTWGKYQAYREAKAALDAELARMAEWEALLRPIQERLRIEEVLIQDAARALARALARARAIEKCERIRRGRAEEDACSQYSCIPNYDQLECTGGSCQSQGIFNCECEADYSEETGILTCTCVSRKESLKRHVKTLPTRCK
jgi:hypothetical protein